MSESLICQFSNTRDSAITTSFSAQGSLLSSSSAPSPLLHHMITLFMISQLKAGARQKGHQLAPKPFSNAESTNFTPTQRASNGNPYWCIRTAIKLSRRKRQLDIIIKACKSSLCACELHISHCEWNIYAFDMLSFSN